MPQNDLTSVSRAQTASPRPRKVPRVVVLGGGSVGLYAARRLRKKLGRREAAIVVVDPRPYMTYAPFLPEAAAGSIDGRDVVAPHRRALKGVDVLQGKVVSIDHAKRQVTIHPEEGDDYSVTYDHLIVGLGSVSRTLPIPGLAENAIGFKNVEEAIAVRNHVLNRMDVASSTWDEALRRRMLTFTFVGGGFAGVEAIAEIEDMARYATRNYATIEEKDLRFVMIEGAGRILPELSEPMAGYALEEPEEARDRVPPQHVPVVVRRRARRHVDGRGVRLRHDRVDRGRQGEPGHQGGLGPPRGQDGPRHGAPDAPGRGRRRQRRPERVGRGRLRRRPGRAQPRQVLPAERAARDPRGHAPRGQPRARACTARSRSSTATRASVRSRPSVCTRASRSLFGVFSLRGVLAWLMHRSYHVMAMPTGNRKIRIFIGWIGQFLLGRELVSLGSLHDPRAEFRAASVPPKKDGEPVKQTAQGSAAAAEAGVSADADEKVPAKAS